MFNATAPVPLQDPLAKVTGATAKEMSPLGAARRNCAVRRWQRSRTRVRGKHRCPRHCCACWRTTAATSRNSATTSGLPWPLPFAAARTAPLSLDSHPKEGPETSFGGDGGSISPARSSGEQEQATVGDLHWRQKRYKEAATAYELALKKLVVTLHAPRTSADLQRLLSAVALANKLTHACEAAGDGSGAQRGCELSLKFARAALELSEALKGKPAEKGSIALPSRLIVSAPKKLLEQAGSGKMTFEEFRKAASVQHLRFPRVEK